MARRKVYESKVMLEGAERIRQAFVLSAQEEQQPQHVARCRNHHRWVSAARRVLLQWRARLLNMDGTLFRDRWEYYTDKLKLAQPTCPQCSAEPVVKKPVVGKFNPNRKCDDRCINAKSDVCSCSCGGVNHGVGEMIQFQNSTEVAPRTLKATA